MAHHRQNTVNPTDQTLTLSPLTIVDAENDADILAHQIWHTICNPPSCPCTVALCEDGQVVDALAALVDVMSSNPHSLW